MNKKRQCTRLAFCVFTLWVAVFLTQALAKPQNNTYYAEQQAAAQAMQRCMQRIKMEKLQRQIPLSPHEFFDTGMLGEEFNGVTTSLGTLSAKRSTANPDMAALLVHLFQQVGLQKGDRVGAGFSGSFPALNIAVLCAAEAMELEVVVISSVGSSTYGANNPTLSFPEMLQVLVVDGLVASNSAMVTLGGDYDTGANMDPDLLNRTKERLEGYGLPLYVEKDLVKNISHRKELYGTLDCFVAVGGNLTTAGKGEGAEALGQGILKATPTISVDQNSGLLQHYLAQGIPTLNLLNIKKLLADYGMAFDPTAPCEIGTGAIYTHIKYSKHLIVGALLLAFLQLLPYRQRGQIALFHKRTREQRKVK